MNRQMKRGATAFTLIDLLVVIAIISILAAILFPVMATVREQARQSTTMSRLYSLYVGAKLYREDEGRFPAALFGYAEVEDTTLNPPYRPFHPNDIGTNAVVPLTSMKGTFRTNLGMANEGVHKGYLFRDQIKDSETFRNIVSPDSDQSAVTKAYYPPERVWDNVKGAYVTRVSPLGAGSYIDANGVLQDGVLVTWQGTTPPNANGCISYGDAELPNADDTNHPRYYDPVTRIGVPKYFYIMDSADIGPMLNAEGKPIPDLEDPTRQKVIYELHYSADWTRQLGVTCDNIGDGPIVTQLKYKNPPSERTILTYITHHAAFAGSPNVMAILMTGTAKKINYRDAAAQLPLGYRP